MQMTEAEYKELMARFYFLNDKVDDVYRRETDKVMGFSGLLGRSPDPSESPIRLGFP